MDGWFGLAAVNVAAYPRSLIERRCSNPLQGETWQQSRSLTHDNREVRHAPIEVHNVAVSLTGDK